MDNEFVDIDRLFSDEYESKSVKDLKNRNFDLYYRGIDNTFDTVEETWMYRYYIKGGDDILFVHLVYCRGDFQTNAPLSASVTNKYINLLRGFDLVDDYVTKDDFNLFENRLKDIRNGDYETWNDLEDKNNDVLKLRGKSKQYFTINTFEIGEEIYNLTNYIMNKYQGGNN